MVMIIVIAKISGGILPCGLSFDCGVEVGFVVAVELPPGLDVGVEEVEVDVVGVAVGLVSVLGTTVICVLAVLFWLVASKTVKVTL